MPYKQIWQDPEVFISYKNTIIYFTYIDDVIDKGKNLFFYTPFKDYTKYRNRKPEDIKKRKSFDIRLLPSAQYQPEWPKFIDWVDPKLILPIASKIIRESITDGFIGANYIDERVSSY